MRMTKAEEIKLSEDRIARISHCLSELKQMFQADSSINYGRLCLEWQDSEQPQMIVKVEDKEVHEAIKDSRVVLNVESVIDDSDKTSISEKINFLEDSFREETLQKIMDGVLEVRWEDEIKKDIVKPECLSKDPVHYTNEDLASIKAYEKALEDLAEERLKYKSVLESEMSNVQETLRTSTSNFNTQMKLFFLKRMKLESAVLQETLMRLRESRRQQLRIASMDKLLQLENDELNPALKDVQKLLEESMQLETTVNDTRNRYENLTKREKLLEGKFRGEFPDLKQPMVEHLLRHYKKRPRIGQLVCTSITYLTEISKCILSGEKSEILPRECLDFLKGMNSLDMMPTSLPSQIDSNHWYLLSKLRRAKVEIETRLKSCAVELAEAEQTFLNHQKTIQNAQTRVQQLREAIVDLRHRNIEELRNLEVQLVLKMGQIETDLSGHPQEFRNTVLVSFDEVLRVNEAIVDAGRKKLGAMNQTIVFRRTTEWREWRHNCLKMILEDMREELKILQGVKVTKEIQKYLMRDLHEAGGEKDIETWTRSVESTKKRHCLMLEDEKEQLTDITKRINEWQKQNDRLIDSIERVKLTNLEVLANDDALQHTKRDERFRQAKLQAIMKRNRLITKVQDNYEDLLSLRTQLELLRLKTYPTLRLKASCDRGKPKEN